MYYSLNPEGATVTHAAPPGQAQPFSCQAEMASLAAVGGGGQIAPLCGQGRTP